MKINQPIGPEPWAPVFIRIPLGFYLFIQGYLHLTKVNEIVAQVKGFHVIPEHLAQFYGQTLPFLSVAVGFLLLIGLWTTLASGISTLMIASVIYAFKDYPKTIWAAPTLSMILLGCSISLLFSGSGAISIDKPGKGGD